MVYQLITYDGDLLGLNDHLRTLQLTDGCEILDVIPVTQTSYLIKLKAPNTEASWWTKIFN